MGTYILGGLFFVCGSVVAILGYRNLVTTRRKRATWLAIEGSVVGLAETLDNTSSKGRSVTLYAPVYRYVADGVEHRATSKMAASTARYKVGDPIKVLVNPMNPGDSDVLDGDISLFTFGMIALGLMVAAVGALFTWLGVIGVLKLERYE